MAVGFDLFDQGRRLLLMTAQSRLRLIESELALGLTFCMVLETYLRLGEVDAARKDMKKLQYIMDLVRQSIHATGGLSAEQLEELRSRLAKLERRVREVESRLKRPEAREAPSTETTAGAEELLRGNMLTGRTPR